MPNVKIFVDEPIWTGQRAALSGSLAEVRSVICQRLGATTDLCHVMLVPAVGLSDQAGVYVDMNFRPKPDRTREKIMATCEGIEAVLREVVGGAVRVRAAAQNMDASYAVS
jgi:hypothetical protein